MSLRGNDCFTTRNSCISNCSTPGLEISPYSCWLMLLLYWQEDWQFEGAFTKSYSMLILGMYLFFFPLTGMITRKKIWPCFPGPECGCIAQRKHRLCIEFMEFNSHYFCLYKCILLRMYKNLKIIWHRLSFMSFIKLL